MNICNFALKHFCLVDCLWGNWTRYGICSVSCGQGKQRYTRTKIRQENFYGKCEGSNQKFEPCNEGRCPGKTIISRMSMNL